MRREELKPKGVACPFIKSWPGKGSSGSYTKLYTNSSCVVILSVALLFFPNFILMILIESYEVLESSLLIYSIMTL